MLNEIALQDRFILQQKIIERFIKGAKAASIAKELKLTRAQVNEHIDEWRQLNATNPALRERGREAVMVMDDHFGMILEELWDAHDNLKNDGDEKSRTVTLKTIADVEAKRVEALQKAGLIDDAEIGEQLAEAEAKFDEIKAIIKDVVKDCPRCRPEVMERLRRLNSEEEPIVVSAEEADYVVVHEH